MEFVFSAWYFVMIALVVGIAVCVTLFVLMDKKDKVLIKEFIESAQSNNESEPVKETENTSSENKSE